MKLLLDALEKLTRSLQAQLTEIRERVEALEEITAKISEVAPEGDSPL